MNYFIEILGWVGSVEVILAYALNSLQKIKSNSFTFQSLNLTGAIFLIVNSLHKEAYQFTLINVVWAVIAILAIIQMVQKKSN